MITLKQVEAFYWVATLGSFASAASRIHVAQSTVSKRILEMEQALSIELFDREQRSGRVTTKGTEILALAEKLLRMRDRFVEAAGNKDAVSGTLRVGITELVAMTWLPRFIRQIKATYPQLDIEPVVDLVVNLYARLEDRSIDLVIGPRVYKDDRFDSKLLSKVEQAWMCSPEMYPGRGTMPMRDLRNMTLLMQSSGSGLQFMLAKLLDEQGIRPKSVIYCNGMLALAEMAASGLGITCLPRNYFASYLKTKRLKVVTTTPSIPPLLYAVASRRDAVSNLGSIAAVVAVECCDFDVAPYISARAVSRPHEQKRLAQSD